MRRSVGELRAEILKAGRGAGIPLGVAEDFAQAAAWFNLAALEELVSGLADGCDGPLVHMSLLFDRQKCGEPVTGQGPLWAVLCDAEEGSAATLPEIPDVLWARLSDFAARTYVPETGQSRASGAGAGNIDND